MTGKVAVFIDGGYLDHLRDHRRVGRLDLEKLVHSAVGGGELLRAYYYACMPFQGEPPTEEERSRYAKKYQFLSVVRRLPRFEVRLGKIQRIGDDVRQKRVDILLAIELVSLAWKGSIDLGWLLQEIRILFLRLSRRRMRGLWFGCCISASRVMMSCWMRWMSGWRLRRFWWIPVSVMNENRYVN